MSCAGALTRLRYDGVMAGEKQRSPSAPALGHGATAGFAAGRDEFREWMTKRPRGYVLNTHRDYSDPENTRLHRATCFTLEPGFGGGADQTGEQFKVCSPDP